MQKTISADELIANLRSRLRESWSPIALEGELWDEVAAHAQTILRDALTSLNSAHPHVSELTGHIADLGTRLAARGIHPLHSMQAGFVLLDVILPTIAAFAEEFPDGVARLASAIQSAQQGVRNCVEAGALRYDSSFLAKVSEMNQEMRKSLARDVHDHIGNSISLAMRRVEMHEMATGTASTHLAAAKDTLAQTLRDMRDLINGLRTEQLTGSLETALRALIDSLGQPETATRLTITGREDRLPESVAGELFVVLREVLRNAFTHSEASNIHINIEISPSVVVAVVIDDGNGFDLIQKRQSGSINGLMGMVERMEQLHGSACVLSTLGAGTYVRLWLPLESGSNSDRNPCH